MPLNAPQLDCAGTATILSTSPWYGTSFAPENVRRDVRQSDQNVPGLNAGEWTPRTAPPSPNVIESLPGAIVRVAGYTRYLWSRYRGVNTQNSWPSGSAMTTQLTSPWPMSMRVAPRETRRSTSAC